MHSERLQATVTAGDFSAAGLLFQGAGGRRAGPAWL